MTHTLATHTLRRCHTRAQHTHACALPGIEGRSKTGSSNVPSPSSPPHPTPSDTSPTNHQHAAPYQQSISPAGSKVIPGFGIHPWWAHLHASSQGSTWQQLLEAPSQQQLQAALDILTHTDPVTNSGAYATNRPNAPQADKAGTTTATSNNNSRNESRDSSSGGSPGNGTFTGIQVGSAKPEQQQGQQQQQQASKQSRLCLGEGLRVVPQQEWMGRLRQLLEDMPGAIVGGVWVGLLGRCMWVGGCMCAAVVGGSRGGGGIWLDWGLVACK